jgi:YfiH family protein
VSYIKPNWPAPANVHAFTTTRVSGLSLAPFGSNNLGLHVGDESHHVLANRRQLEQELQLPSSPEWLEQTHSTDCVLVEEDLNRVADASISRSPAKVLSIMTADCLPILLCNKEGTEIAAVHAGWKGLVNGIVENTLAKMQRPRDQILAWCGPAICHNCFEVGEEVFDLYQEKYPFAEFFFKKHHVNNLKFLANLPKLLEEILRQSGINNVYQSNLCTFEEENNFYSYRRDQKTGRIASLIWFNEE